MLEIPKSNGILTTDENKIDKIAREAWEKVFKGNIQDEDKMIYNFLENTKNTSLKVKKKKLNPLIGKMSKTNVQTQTPLEVWMSGRKKNFT